MKNASKTGGAVGQVSERELAALQAVLGSLDTGQSGAQLKENIELIKIHYNNAVRALTGDMTEAEADKLISIPAEGTTASDGKGNQMIFRGGRWQNR